MKHGHPSREHSRGKEKREMQPHVKTDMKRGVAHLREHHMEERREVDRSHETGHAKECR